GRVIGQPGVVKTGLRPPNLPKSVFPISLLHAPQASNLFEFRHSDQRKAKTIIVCLDFFLRPQQPSQDFLSELELVRTPNYFLVLITPEVDLPIATPKIANLRLLFWVLGRGEPISETEHRFHPVLAVLDHRLHALV